MKKYFTILAALLMLVALTQLGCETHYILDGRMNTLQEEISQIDAQGARVCAPREFASAEAHLQFAREEWSERDYIECQDHLVIVREQIDSAQQWLATCTETEPPDKDGDGVLDDVDQCPDDPEDIDGFEDEDGCPDPDNDGDGILDAVDLCPDEAEDMDEFEDEDGCPDTDNDGDGILDADDECPNEAGPAESNGCPAMETDNIRVTDDAIVLKRNLNFDTGRSTIRPDSFAILDDIVKVLVAHKTWNIMVEGHTDNRGSQALNMRLSQARADSVRSYLISHGVEAERLTAQGFAFDRPIASNSTRDGRARNRRVEFKITSK